MSALTALQICSLERVPALHVHNAREVVTVRALPCLQARVHLVAFQFSQEPKAVCTALNAPPAVTALMRLCSPYRVPSVLSHVLRRLVLSQFVCLAQVDSFVPLRVMETLLLVLVDIIAYLVPRVPLFAKLEDSI